MNNPRKTHTTRTFIPQLGELRKYKARVYEGKLGDIGTSQRSRYALVAISAVLALLAFVGSSVITPYFAAGVGIIAVALIAGGWPAATGVAELRGEKRLTGHSAIILLSGVASVLLALFDPNPAKLSLLPAVAAVGIVASFIVELVRGEGAVGRLESTISCISGVLAAVSVAGWVGLAGVYESSRSSASILGIGLIIAIILGAFGARIISAGPTEGPRRGAITLGVTPVAFVGVLGYVCAIFLTRVIG